MRSASTQRGSAIVYVLLMLGILFGFVALATDIGFMLEYDRRAQIAADAAVLAAVRERVIDGDASDLVLGTAARQAAAMNGFEHGVDGVQILLDPDYASDEVEVQVTHAHPTFFLRAVGVDSLQVSARAVAAQLPTGPTSCLTIGSMDVKNNDHLVADGDCSLFIDPAGGGLTTCDGTNEAGAINVDAPCVQGTEIDEDMEAPVPPRGFPSAPGGCQDAVCDGERTFTPGCYNKIEIKNDSDCVFAAGEYHIKEEMKISEDALVEGTGVVFFLHRGLSVIELDGDVTLTAPASGDWAGLLLFYEAGASGQKMMFKNKGRSELTGHLYAPDAYMEMDQDLILHAPAGLAGGSGNGVAVVLRE